MTNVSKTAPELISDVETLPKQVSVAAQGNRRRAWKAEKCDDSSSDEEVTKEQAIKDYVKDVEVKNKLKGSLEEIWKLKEDKSKEAQFECIQKMGALMKANKVPEEYHKQLLFATLRKPTGIDTLV